MFHTKVQNDTSEPIPVTNVGGSSGDGAILDGVSSSIKATVKDLAGDNALAVAIVDGAGSQITSFGGGTQYTEGDVDASVTGTALMWEDAADTLRVASAAKPLPTSNATTSVVGNGAAATAQRVTLANDSTGVLATVTNLAQLAGQAIAMNTGTRSAGTQRVTIATDDLVPVSNSVLSVVGNGAAATAQRVTLANDSTGVLATVSTVTNLSQLGGQAIAMNTGTRSAGTQRVTIATDDVVPASQSGTWNQGILPRTSGGMTTYHLVSANTTNATVVKNSAGQLFGWYIYNNNSSMRKVAFHNTASAPTAGASIFFTINIPGSSAANVFSDIGIAFSSGIAITTVTDVTDAGATAVGTSDLTINLFYA